MTIRDHYDISGICVKCSKETLLNSVGFCYKCFGDRIKLVSMIDTVCFALCKGKDRSDPIWDKTERELKALSISDLEQLYTPLKPKEISDEELDQLRRGNIRLVKH